jgi:hypothetical protein
VPPPSGRHEDSLTPVAQAPVSRGGTGGFQLFAFVFPQGDCNHLSLLPLAG